MNDYPITLGHSDEGWVVTFPDFPEAVTQGDTREEAMRNAVDCLDEAIAARVFAREPLPLASLGGDARVSPSVTVALKAALNDAVRVRKLTIRKFAQSLDVGETEARRILDPHHATRLSRLDEAVRALGKRVRVELVDA